MRKIALAMVAVMVFVMAFTGCSKEPEMVVNVEAPVTIQQVNTEGKYVARAFIESLFKDDKALFTACYPEGFVDDLNAAAGVDVYEQYRSVFQVTGTYEGTGFAGYKEYTVANGYDEGYMRSRICSVTGLEYGQIGQIQLQKIRLFVKYDTQTIDSDFYIIVYESNGSWYVLESIKNEREF